MELLYVKCTWKKIILCARRKISRMIVNNNNLYLYVHVFTNLLGRRNVTNQDHIYTKQSRTEIKHGVYV